MRRAKFLGAVTHVFMIQVCCLAVDGCDGDSEAEDAGDDVVDSDVETTDGE